jgi:hypothetical protein
MYRVYEVTGADPETLLLAGTVEARTPQEACELVALERSPEDGTMYSAISVRYERRGKMRERIERTYVSEDVEPAQLEVSPQASS